MYTIYKPPRVPYHIASHIITQQILHIYHHHCYQYHHYIIFVIGIKVDILYVGVETFHSELASLFQQNIGETKSQLQDLPLLRL